MTEEEKRERDRKRNDLKWVVSSPQGRRFYWELMAECGAFQDKFVESSNLSNFLKGARSVGLNLFHDLLDAEPLAYTKMREENEAKKTRTDIKTEKQIKDKQNNPLKIDSPSLPNTGQETSVEATQ